MDMRARASSGFTLVELLMVVAIIGVLASLTTPALLRARTSANEAATLASLRAINNAQRAFASSCGDGLYAPTLEALGVPPENGAQGFLSSDLAKPAPVRKNGYTFSVGGDRPEGGHGVDACSHTKGGPAASELLAGYYATAVSGSFVDGSRDFWTNTGGALFEKPRGGSFASTNVIGWPQADPQARPAQAPVSNRGDVGGLANQ